MLMPARHSHKEIDGLPSVFSETENPFELQYSEEFQPLLVSQELSNIDIDVDVYVTGNTYASLKLFKNIMDWNIPANISVNFRHFNRDANAYDITQCVRFQKGKNNG